MEPIEVILPSGAVLKITPAPFAQAKVLYQAMLSEVEGIEIKNASEYADLIKRLFCAGFSSALIDRAMQPCLQRCLYITPDGVTLKVIDETFEPVNRREDYFSVLAAVGKANVEPFMKGLFAKFREGMAMINNFRESMSQTTP